MKKTFLSYPYILWSILFTVVPLFIIIAFSFSSVDEIGKIGGFTFENYQNFFDPVYLSVFMNSIKISVKSTIISFIIGYPVAYIISKKNLRTRSFLLMFIILPQWTNFLLRTYAWMSILRDKGLINSFLLSLNLIDEPIKFLYNDGAILMGMVYNFLPYMILPIYTTLIKIDKRYIEAARDLGADTITVFRKIIFPLSLPGVISGVIMVFMPAVSTFVISDLLGGGHYMLMGNLIQNQFLAARNWQFGSAVSAILIVIILISMFFLNKAGDKTSGDNIW